MAGTVRLARLKKPSWKQWVEKLKHMAKVDGCPGPSKQRLVRGLFPATGDGCLLALPFGDHPKQTVMIPFRLPPAGLRDLFGRLNGSPRSNKRTEPREFVRNRSQSSRQVHGPAESAERAGETLLRATSQEMAPGWGHFSQDLRVQEPKDGFGRMMAKEMESLDNFRSNGTWDVCKPNGGTFTLRRVHRPSVSRAVA